MRTVVADGNQPTDIKVNEAVQDLRRAGTDLRSTYTRVHGHLFDGLKTTRYCDVCKSHKSMAETGWKKWTFGRWKCPLHQEPKP